MGGFGSGRRSRQARKTSEMSSIDLADFNRCGVLKQGGSGTVAWSRGGREAGRIAYVLCSHGLRVHYRSQRSGCSEWTEVDELIPFAETDQHLGRARKWFECLGCGRRARVLFAGTYYRCRQCHGLTYESQYDK